MMRALLFVLAIVLAVAEQDNIVKSKASQVGLLQNSIKELNLKKLEGKWYEIAASQIIHQTSEKGCDCFTSSFHLVQQSRFHVLNECSNRTTDKRETIEGTLTQLMPDRHPGAFYIDFKQTNAPGLDIVHAQKETEQKENVKENVKDQQNKETVKESSVTLKDLKDLKTAIGKEEAGKEPNFLILKFVGDKGSVGDKAMLVAGPTGETAWIMARTQSLDRHSLKRLMDDAHAKGFANIIYAPCQQ